jgi:hypothetical protein
VGLVKPGKRRVVDSDMIKKHVLESVVPDGWKRVHDFKYNGNSYNPVQHISGRSGGRFDSVKRDCDHHLYDPYSYTYLSQSSFGAITEALLGRRWLGTQLGPGGKLAQDRVERLCLTYVRATEAITVLRIDSEKNNLECGLPPNIAKASNYSTTREWASWLRLKSGHHIHGLMYVGQLSGELCLVLFKTLSGRQGRKFLNKACGPCPIDFPSDTVLHVQERIRLVSDEGTVFLDAACEKHKITRLP